MNALELREHLGETLKKILAESREALAAANQYVAELLKPVLQPYGIDPDLVIKIFLGFLALLFLVEAVRLNSRARFFNTLYKNRKSLLAKSGKPIPAGELEKRVKIAEKRAARAEARIARLDEEFADLLQKAGIKRRPAAAPSGNPPSPAPGKTRTS